MGDVQITCPGCGHRFPDSDALSAQIRDTMETHLRADFDKRIKRKVAQAEKHAREQLAPELKLLTEQLAEARGKAAEAQQAELALRKKAEAVEARGRELDLEIARRLAVEKQRLEESLRRAAGDRTDPVIVINADAKATHQSVVDIMQAAQTAGYPHISFATQAHN